MRLWFVFNQKDFRRGSYNAIGLDWVGRGMKESISILTLSPSINTDLGCHKLSFHFDYILEAYISVPPALETHDPSKEDLVNTAPRRKGRPRKEPTQQPTKQLTQQPSTGQPETASKTVS